MFDKIGISVQGNFVRRQEGVLLRKSGRKLKSLFYLTIIVVLCIFLGGCNKKGEITFEQAADEDEQNGKEDKIHPLEHYFLDGDIQSVPVLKSRRP